jgi:hypothetical protein
MISPWSPDAEELIRGSLRHTFSVRIFPDTGAIVPDLPVKVTACTITYDEFWSPYIQGELTAEIPDAATLAALDPRLLVRVDVSAGYVLPGGALDEHPMAHCYLSSTSIDYPSNELHLAFQGAEYLFDKTIAASAAESPTWSSGGQWDSGTTVETAITSCLFAVKIDLLSLAAPHIDPYLRHVTDWVDPAEPWVGQAGDNPMDMAREIADRIDAWFRCGDDGQFNLTPRFWLTSDPSHYLRVGADGTIISSSQGSSRGEWANRAAVRYEWQVLTTSGGVSTAVVKSARGTAELSDTPYDRSIVGAVTVRSERRWPSSATLAKAAAAALLRRHSVRATTLQLSAIAAYWLRPPDGIRVDLPVGPQLKLNVSAISFDLVTGRMDIRTRNPESGNVQAL